MYTFNEGDPVVFKHLHGWGEGTFVRSESGMNVVELPSGKFFYTDDPLLPRNVWDNRLTSSRSTS